MRFSKIKSIRKMNPSKVYDIINIDKNHNFIANDMVVHNCDEAIQFASGQEHNKTESRELKKLFTVIRPKRFWIFFNIPDMLWIDSKYREGMASFWLRMIERGTGIIFEKNKAESKDKWETKRMQELMGTIKFFTPMDKLKRNLMKHPCYFDMFRFPNLPQEIYDDYEYVRNAISLQRRVEEQSFNNKDYAKIASYNLIHNWERISVAIQRSKENRTTYKLLSEEIFSDPVTTKRLVGDVTIRNWVGGIQDYIKTKGQDAKVFSVEPEPEPEPEKIDL
jgi:hypothetical protein